MKYMSSSVPLPFRVLHPSSTNLLLFFVYPFLRSILSMLGEKGCGPWRPESLNSIPVSSHLPVQRAAAHSWVSSNGMFLILASFLREMNRYAHGREESSFGRFVRYSSRSYFLDFSTSRFRLATARALNFSRLRVRHAIS